jgi:hypothetical protein
MCCEKRAVFGSSALSDEEKSQWLFPEEFGRELLF